MARRSLEERYADKKKKEQQAKEERRQLAGMLKEANRNKDTRRKILIGSMFLKRMESDPNARQEVMAGLDKFLGENRDRVLFGLPLLAEEKVRGKIVKAANSDSTEARVSDAPQEPTLVVDNREVA